MSDVNYLADATKLQEAKELFNKVFAPIKGLNIASEYVKVRLKLSNLSKSKRGLILAYVQIRKNNDPKFKEVYDELDKRIEESAAKLKTEGKDKSTNSPKVNPNIPIKSRKS